MKYREKIKRWTCLLCCIALLSALPVSNVFAEEQQEAVSQESGVTDQLAAQEEVSQSGNEGMQEEKTEEEIPEAVQEPQELSTDGSQQTSGDTEKAQETTELSLQKTEEGIAPVTLEAADPQEITLEKVLFNSDEAQPLKKDPSVWVLTTSTTFLGKAITGHFASDSLISISISHPILNGDSTTNQSTGKFWTITKQPKDFGGDFEVTLDYPYDGAYALQVTATAEDGNQKTYTWILAYVKSATDPLSVSLLDAVNLVDLNTDMKPVDGDLNSLFRIYEADEDTSSVELQVHRNITARDETQKSLKWMVADQNWVSLNGSDPVRFDTASNENEERYSPNLNLKPGLNVVSLFCANSGDSDLKATNFANTKNLAQRGFYNSLPYAYQGFVYLIYYAGEEKELDPPSNNTDISYIGVTQYTSNNNNPAQSAYPAQVAEDGEGYVIALPEKMPKMADQRFFLNGIVNETKPSNGIGWTHETILLNLKTSDPYAKAEVVDTLSSAEGEDYIYDYPNRNTDTPTVAAITMIDGAPWGNQFTPVNTWHKNEILVKVTAADGTEKTHTIKIVRASSKTDINSLTVNGGTLATEDETPAVFSSGVYNYYVDLPSSEGELSFMVDVPDGITFAVDGVNREKGTISLDASLPVHKLVVTAADGISKQTYIFLTRIGGATVPLFQVNKQTAAYAEDMLSGWNSRPEEEKKDISDSYWELYKTISTMDPENVTEEKDALKALEGSYVYDVTKHNFRQATDYAAVILELIMLGQNPYNYKGTDYVAELMKENDGTGNFGPFANNIWTLMAFKAAGAEIPEALKTAVKNQAMTASGDLDMRGWAMAAAAEYMTPLEIARWASSIVNTQMTSGEEIGMFKHPSYLTINTMTHGCVMTGIAGAGMDVQGSLFAACGRDPLTALKQEYMLEDGEFNYNRQGFSGYSKDVIIALGDILHGSNVWQRYTLTDAKYEKLLKDGQALMGGSAGSETERNAVQSALTAAKTAEEDTNNISKCGKEYFALYEAMSAIDTGLKADVLVGSPLDMFNDMVNALPESITAQDKESIAAVRDFYEGLSQTNKETANAATLLKFRNSQGAIIGLEAGNDAQSAFETILALPSSLIITLDDKSQVETARKAYNALTAEQKTWIDWAGTSVLERLTAAEEMIKKLSDPTDPVKTMTVTFKLLGGEKHGDTTPVYIYAKNKGKFETWIPETSYTFNSSSVTVYQVLTRALAQYGLDSVGADSNYVSKIKNPDGEWLGEFDNGPNSGWMYVVDGTHPSVGLKACKVSNGSKIVWHYTDDYTQEEGSEKWSGGSTAAAEKTADVRLEPTAKISNGAASVSLTLSDLKDAIVSTKTGGDIVIAPVIKGEVTAVRIELNKEALSAVAKQTKADLKLQTPEGYVTLPNKVLDSIASQMTGTTAIISIEKLEQSAEKLEQSALSTSQQKLTGDGTVYEVSIISGKENISSFDGESIKISLPYKLKAGQQESGVAVWYLNDQAGLEKINCTYSKSIEMATFSTTHLSRYAVGYDAWTNPFADVKSDSWFYGAVAFATRNGLFNGTSATAFSPNTQMSRAMLVTVLYRLEGSPAVTGSNSFSDVKGDQWYTNAIIWANTNGIVSGIGNNTFGTDKNVTREQMSTILYNYAKYKGYDVTKAGEVSSFTDAGQIQSWALDSVKWARGQELINGRTTATLVPDGSASRAEVATILMRFSEGVAK
ncbi:S-layer homology domain-containing protein [Aminipila luticellarii]|nr:S-layer homology domain-containing protein [Aminipila luticellarii]